MPTYRSHTTAIASLEDGITFDKPTGVLVGEILIFQVTTTGGTGATITPPEGVTLIRRDNNGTSLAQAIYYRIIQDAESSTYLFTFDNGRNGAGFCVCYMGTEGVLVSDGQANSSSANCTAPTLTPTKNGSLLLFCGGATNTATWTPPTGMEERIDNPKGVTGPTCCLAELQLSNTSATGAKTGTLSGAALNIGQSLIFSPGSLLGNFPLFIKGHLAESAAMPLYSTAGDATTTISGNIPLYVVATTELNGSIPLALLGHLTNSGSCPLFVWAHQGNQGSIPLIIGGNTSLAANFPLFLISSGSSTTSIPLSIVGASPNSSSVPLFLKVNSGENSTIPLTILGPLSLNGSIPLFLSVGHRYLKRKILYIMRDRRISLKIEKRRA